MVCLSLGSLALLTGCDLSTHSGVDAALWAMLRFDDRVQAALFNPQRLAETYRASAITRPFRFNAYTDLLKFLDASVSFIWSRGSLAGTS